MVDLTYSSFVDSLANLLVVPSTDPNFLTALPNIITDAENRILRDVYFLATISSTLIACSTTTRTVTLSTVDEWEIVNSVNLVYGTSAGPKLPLPQVSLDYVDAVYPYATVGSSTTRPACFAMLTDQTLVLGPPAGASSLSIEVIGYVRQASLSSANSSTYLTRTVPDLFLIAGCMFGSAYLKNWSAASDDPRSGLTWSEGYKATLAGVIYEEEMRRTQEPQARAGKAT